MKARPNGWTSQASTWAGRWAAALCVLLLVSSMPGCQCTGAGGGATGANAKKKKADEDKEKEKKKKLPNFEMGRLRLQPTDEQQLQVYVKPGHWVSASVQARANNFDASGELATATTDSGGQPKIIEGTSFQVGATRPVALAKGQAKPLEATWFIHGSSPFLDYKLMGRAGNELLGAAQPVGATMSPDEFYMIVLADNPDLYTYFSLLDVAKPPRPGLESEQTVEYLRIVRPRVDATVPLPSHPLTWTMVSTVLWDNINPSSLSIDQQTAMVDWLHWGGNLILSGPDTLEKLQGSFLDAYLPADPAGVVKLGPDAFQTLNEKWSLRRTQGDKLTLNVLENEPLLGVKLDPRPQSAEVQGTGGLVQERRVGVGRVVVTAFSLKQRAVVNWGSYDNFVNGCLLRRPARRYSQDAVGDLALGWADPSYRLRDPRLISYLRFFSRDVGPRGENDRTPEDWRTRGYATSATGGVAAWDNRSPVSAAAREILADAAGIDIPKAEFVVQVLAVYLVILVPLNWLFFRLIGRVEYAWVAAPVIAVVGSVAVVKLAELDIGFARSRTEAAILEIHAEHPRAHLTRFTALYSSLSTAHRLRFDDPGALALPFPAQPDRQLGRYDTIYKAVMKRAGDATLNNFFVKSNFTEYARTEQMMALTGVLRLTGDETKGWALENGSQIDLSDVVVLRRTDAGQLQASRLGELPAKMAKDAPFAPVQLEAGATNSSYFDDIDVFYREPRKGELSLRKFLELAVNSLDLLPGESRMLAWVGGEVDPMEVTPRVSQQLIRTLVVVHLQQPPWPACERDSNLRSDFRDEEKPLTERDLGGGEALTPLERDPNQQ